MSELLQSGINYFHDSYSSKLIGQSHIDASTLYKISMISMSRYRGAKVCRDSEQSWSTKYDSDWQFFSRLSLHRRSNLKTSR